MMAKIYSKTVGFISICGKSRTFYKMCFSWKTIDATVYFTQPNCRVCRRLWDTNCYRSLVSQPSTNSKVVRKAITNCDIWFGKRKMFWKNHSTISYEKNKMYTPQMTFWWMTCYERDNRNYIDGDSAQLDITAMCVQEALYERVAKLN